MTHNRYDRRAWFQIFRIILFFFLKFVLLFNADKLNIRSKFMRYQFYDFSVKPLIDRNDDAEVQTGFDDLCYRHVQQVGQFRHGNKLRDMNDLFSVLYVFRTGGGLFSFQAAILCFCALTLRGATEACHGLANLFLYLLGGNFLRFIWCERCSLACIPSQWRTTVVSFDHRPVGARCKWIWRCAGFCCIRFIGCIDAFAFSLFFSRLDDI